MELGLLFGALPVAVAFVPRLGFPVLFAAAAGCLWALLRDPSFDRGELRRLPEWSIVVPTTVRALLLCTVLAATAWAIDPASAFGLLRRQPRLWLLVILLYPLLSVPVQELVYRTFFLHRYGRLFASDGARVLASSAAFGLAHLLLWNGFAVGLSTLGGLLFAGTYLRSRSLPAVCWEHALYGVVLFTTGFGRYFVTGWLHPP